MAHILYISYDGLLEPLGQSQVLQYLIKLAKNHKITLVSYEKAQDWADVPKREALQKSVKQAGVQWLPLRYHKSPSALATAYDLLVGLSVCIYLSIRYRVQIVHARSYVPSVIALTLKRILNKKFIFDMRGFWPDEKVDGGHWLRNSRIYRVAKWFEKQFLTHADIVVSLTHAGVSAMQQFPYLKNRLPRFEVITTCTNLALFCPMPSTTNVKNSKQLFTIGYVGTTGNWYLFDPVMECFQLLLKIHPNIRFLIINRDEHQYIQERLNAYNIPKEHVEIKAAEYSEVPKFMSQMDASIFFIKPVFSKRGSAPTKLGEFLACGVPCLTNAGVGDVKEIINDEKVGVIIEDFARETLEQALAHFLRLMLEPSTKQRCITAAQNRFSLEEGVKKYDHIYYSLK
ncbi:glycosyltransferase [Candidatus Parabeggiatoa sp. HSG14]|uniref:glycosyltransferase n=1 Tax=Candidatus Parabeggiatoa sp. HSG14 TaxID=3055593 RepID=UPI0025A7B703|nr:glycosyltransferase [Thiotrichales bacterium HSG14]